MDLPLLFINKSIFVVKTPIGLPLWLLVSLLRRNLRRGLTVTYLKVKGLGVELIFNKNVIELGDDIEYIKEAVNAVVILHTNEDITVRIIYLLI